MSKTLKYLPEGADFSARDFDQRYVFSRTPQVQHFARGGLVQPAKNKSAGNPSTDPTSSDVQSTKDAETDYRQSGGYGFKSGGKVKCKKGGKVRKYARGGPVKMADGGAIQQPSRMVQALAMVNPAIRKMIQGQGQPSSAASPAAQMGAPDASQAPPELQASALRMGQAAGQHIAKQMQSDKGRRRIFGPGALANAGMAKGGGVKKKFAVGGYTAQQDSPSGPSIGERLFGLPKTWEQIIDPTYKFGKIGNPLHEFGFGLLGIRKNNAPIQDIQQALAAGIPITDQQWIKGGYGPGGLGYWQGTRYPGAQPNVGARGGPPMVNMPAGFQEKLEADPVYRRAAGLNRGGPVRRYAEGGSVTSDAAQDKALVRKGVRQHETNMHAGKTPTALKLNAGGAVRDSRGGMQAVTKLNSGGQVRR